MEGMVIGLAFGFGFENENYVWINIWVSCVVCGFRLFVDVLDRGRKERERERGRVKVKENKRVKFCSMYICIYICNSFITHFNKYHTHTHTHTTPSSQREQENRNPNIKFRTPILTYKSEVTKCPAIRWEFRQLSVIGWMDGWMK